MPSWRSPRSASLGLIGGAVRARGVVAAGQQLGGERLAVGREHVHLRAGQAGHESSDPDAHPLLRRNGLCCFWTGARGRHRQRSRSVRLHHRRPQQREMLGRPVEQDLDARRRRRQSRDQADGEVRDRQLQRQRGSCLCDGRLVRRHDDGAPARSLPRCLQGRLGDGGHASRVPGCERVRQRRRVQRRVRRRLGHAHRARMGKHRAHVGPGLHRTSPARAAVSRRRRHDHPVREPHRSHQAVDECSGRQYESDVDEHGCAAGEPPGDAAAVAELVRSCGARRIHVDRR